MINCIVFFKILLVILFFPILCYAQKKDQFDSSKPSKINLEVGYLAYLPIGQYGKSSGSINSVGFSNPGIGLSLNLKKLVNDKFSILCEFSFGSNSVKSSEINQNFQNTTLYKSTTKTNNWNLFNYMLGGDYTLVNQRNGDKSMSIYNRFKVGLSSVHSPEINISGNDNSSNSINIQQSSGKSNSFAVQYGIGIKYATKKKGYFGVSIDYFFTNAKFENIPTYVKQNTSTSTTYSSFSQKIESIPFSIYFGLRL